jgi:outer membrane protein assembly factor BamB
MMRLALSAVLAGCLLMTARAGAEDWAHMHGPRYDGLSAETGIQPKFIKQLWKTNVGTGFASIAVADGVAYALGNQNDFDTLYATDAATGAVKWRKSYAAGLQPNSYEGGPNAMPTVHGGKVYTLGKEGQIHCFDAKTGNVVWKRHASEWGASPPDWGFGGPATIHGELALFNVGDAGAALNKDTGEVVWKSSGGGAGYAPLVPFPGPGGQTAFLLFRAAGLAALDPATGREMWSHEWLTGANVNAATPLYFDGKVFISSSYDKGCCLLDVSGDQPRELWRNRNMKNHFSTSAYWKDHIYGMDGHTGRRGNLVCMDPKSGAVVWRREVGFGSLRVADGKLIVLTEDGQLAFADATTTGYLELARKPILSFKCWTVPTIANGRLYARNAPGDLVCYSLTGN